MNGSSMIFGTVPYGTVPNLILNSFVHTHVGTVHKTDARKINLQFLQLHK